MKTLIIFFVLGFFNTVDATHKPSILDEINPRDSKINEILKFYDNDYFETTGESAFIGEGEIKKGNCRKLECPVWVVINKETQTMSLYIEGILSFSWDVSTGRDYNGLGNMPYAVFIRGGYAIHGTPAENWPGLGTAVSGGCIRLHPDNAYIFNRLVRANGVDSVWITVL